MNTTEPTPEGSKEEWKLFTGCYEASTFGRVRSIPHAVKQLNRLGNIITVNKTGRILKQGINNQTGYLRLTMWIGPVKKSILTHRIIAETFKPNPENKPEVNHKNGIKTDNHVDNLEWSTSSENSIHAIQTGLQKIIVGTDCNFAKLTEKDVLLIRASTLKAKELSTTFKVTPQAIRDVQRRKTWNHL